MTATAAPTVVIVFNEHELVSIVVYSTDHI